MSRAFILPGQRGEVKLAHRFTLFYSSLPYALAHPSRPRRRRPDQLHTLQTILLVAPILLFSVIAHEIAHGYAALRQGDRTALEAGRLSWNPLKHIDPFLTILLPLIMLTGSALVGGRLFVFGGAKPVPVDPRNYQEHPSVATSSSRWRASPRTRSSPSAVASAVATAACGRAVCRRSIRPSASFRRCSRSA